MQSTLYERYPYKSIDINSKIYKYIALGESNTSFLIFPGGGQSALSTFELIDAFKSRYKVIAIDIHNFDSIDEFISVVRKILTEEQISNVILYGLSIGGLLAQSFLKKNKDLVQTIFLSHSCTPNSKIYEKKIIRPLTFLSYFLPIIPHFLITFVAKIGASKFQGVSNDTNKKLLDNIDEAVLDIYKFIGEDFYKNYFNKRLLQTWINLHRDFFYNEKLTKKEFNKWNGKMLIIRTDNDPLMQDEGDFKNVYPQASVYTFQNTGHLTFFYKSQEIIKLIKGFI